METIKRAIKNWRKTRPMRGYLAGRVQQLKDQASPKSGRWRLESGKTLQQAIDEEFKYCREEV